ncbi:MAG: saccharopine dehydrogenase NADP-binding domain-containing protein [Actinomycetota bacterium]
MHEVVVVGGAGDMARVAVTKLRLLRDDCRITLADLDVPGAEHLARELGGEEVSAASVDIFDAPGLKEVVSGARLVMNCTGPYYRTGRPVLEACIAGGVDYVDMCDDEDSALSLLELDEKARGQAVTALICCGIAPGLVNVLARRNADMLDELLDIELAWVSGQTPPSEDRPAGSVGVIEHMLHCCVGECATVRDGARTMIPAFKSGRTVDFPEPLGPYMVFELGHAEPATLPRFMPGLRDLRTMGAIHPPYLNGLFRGVAAQVTHGTVNMKKAVDFIVALDTGGKVPAWRPFLGVLEGTAGQLVRGEITIGDLGGLARAARGKLQAESLGGLYVSVTGVKDGKPARITTAQSSAQGEGEGSMDIDVVTGTCLAAFASLMLSGEVTARGVVAPEACVDPPRYLEELDRALPEFQMDLEPRLAWLE